MLLLHGTGSSGHSFDALLPYLAPHRSLVVPDLPGHAATEVPRGFVPSLDGMARAVTSLVEHLELQPSEVVGHSAGAAILARVVLDGALQPDRWIGIAPAMRPFRGLARLLFPTSARLLARSPSVARLIAARNRDRDRVRRVLEGTGSRPSEASLDGYQRLASDPAHVASVLRMMASWDLDPLEAALPHLNVPSIVIAGARDRAVPARETEAAARRLGAPLHVVPDAGHLLHEEQPARVATFLLDA